jgi:hypothetical protein
LDSEGISRLKEFLLPGTFCCEDEEKRYLEW